MHQLVNRFASQHPTSVLQRGNETFIDPVACVELINEAEQAGVRVLGLEGFLIDDESVYPALSRIADFSGDAGVVAPCAHARALLTGAWRSPPTSGDQVDPAAGGRHMVAVVLRGLLALMPDLVVLLLLAVLGALGKLR